MTAQRWLVGLTEYPGVTRYTGGIGTHFAALLPALVRQGIEVDLVVFTTEPPGSDGEAATDSAERCIDGVRVLTVRSAGTRPAAVRLMSQAVRFRWVYRRRKYDAVYLPEWSGVGSLLPRAAPMVTNLATGIRLGDWIAGRRNRDFVVRLRFGRFLHDQLETRQIRRSRALVSISHAVLRWNLHFLGDLEPSVVVRNCVDIDQIKRDAESGALPPGWPEADGLGSPVVVFVGRLERRKGVLAAVQAFAAVLEVHPTARLVLAGSPGDRRFEPTRDELLDEIARHHRKQVVFLGHLPSSQLFAGLRLADVVMCPSLWEGFGNVALEVKAVGVPLIVTRGSGYDDFCFDDVDCLMAEPGDGASLARAILTLLESADVRDRLVQNATASLDRFAPDPVAVDTAAAVMALLSRRPAR